MKTQAYAVMGRCIVDFDYTIRAGSLADALLIARSDCAAVDGAAIHAGKHNAVLTLTIGDCELVDSAGWELYEGEKWPHDDDSKKEIS